MTFLLQSPVIFFGVVASDMMMMIIIIIILLCTHLFGIAAFSSKIITPLSNSTSLLLAPPAMRLMHVTKKELLLVEWILFFALCLSVVEEGGCSESLDQSAPTEGTSNPAVEEDCQMSE